MRQAAQGRHNVLKARALAQCLTRVSTARLFGQNAALMTVTHQQACAMRERNRHVLRISVLEVFRDVASMVREYPLIVVLLDVMKLQESAIPKAPLHLNARRMLAMAIC